MVFPLRGERVARGEIKVSERYLTPFFSLTPFCSQTASEGCPVLDRPVRNSVGGSGIHELEVIP